MALDSLHKSKGPDFLQKGVETLSELDKGQVRANIDVGVVAGFRNKIINGDFNIWQRGAPFNNPAGYGPDRWYLGTGTGATVEYSRGDFGVGFLNVPGSPDYFLQVNRTVAGSSNTVWQQLIEDVRTLAGKVATVTFWARSPTGTTIQTNLRQYFGTSGSEGVNSSAQSHTLTSNWTKFSYSLQLQNITGKTLGSAGNDALILNFFYPHTSPNAVVQIAHVSVVEGNATSEVDPFSPRHVQQELALCQRYCELWGNGAVGRVVTATQVGFSGNFKVQKRAVPSVMLRTTEPSISSIGEYSVAASGASILYTNATKTGISDTYFSGFTGLVPKTQILLRSDAYLVDAEI